MIVAEIDVGFIGPDNLGPVLLFIVAIEVCPAHPCMLMEPHKEGDLPSNMSMVSSMVEDMSNGDLVDFEPQLISEVLAVPPLFLQESGHSGGIPVESGGMKFSRRPC